MKTQIECEFSSTAQDNYGVPIVWHRYRIVEELIGEPINGRKAIIIGNTNSSLQPDVQFVSYVDRDGAAIEKAIEYLRGLDILKDLDFKKIPI